MYDVNELDIIRPQPGDVIVSYFNSMDLDFEQARDLHEKLRLCFPNNTLVSVPDAACIIDYDRNQFLQVFKDVLRDIYPEKGEILGYVEQVLDLLQDDEDLH